MNYTQHPFHLPTLVSGTTGAAVPVDPGVRVAKLEPDQALGGALAIGASGISHFQSDGTVGPHFLSPYGAYTCVDVDSEAWSGSAVVLPGPILISTFGAPACSEVTLYGEL